MYQVTYNHVLLLIITFQVSNQGSEESAGVDLVKQTKIMKGVIDVHEFKTERGEITEQCSGQKDVYMSVDFFYRYLNGLYQFFY